MKRTLASILLLTSLSGCSVWSRSDNTAPAPVPAQATAEVPALPRSVLWVRNSAEHEAIYVQTYRLAEWVLEAQVAELKIGSWAVALDADETVIDNSLYEKELAYSGATMTEKSWDAWVERREATILPGVMGFMKRVKELGGRVAIVTNRRQHHCEATRDVMRDLNVPFDVVLCRGEDGEKEKRWDSVEGGSALPGLPPLRIVMWIGDNIKDFPELDQSSRFGGAAAFADFGTRFFILPNPNYGSWEDNPEE